MFALVLAVIAAASGTLVEEYLHLPGTVGIAALLLLVILFAFYGRAWVMRVLAYKALILCTVFLAYFLMSSFGGAIKSRLNLRIARLSPGGLRPPCATGFIPAL